MTDIKIKGCNGHAIIFPEEQVKTLQDHFKTNEGYDPTPVKIGKLAEKTLLQIEDEWSMFDSGTQVMYFGHASTSFEYNSVKFDAVKLEGVFAIL
jgi:hypothetical protein